MSRKCRNQANLIYRSLSLRLDIQVGERDEDRRSGVCGSAADICNVHSMEKACCRVSSQTLEEESLTNHRED